MPDEFAALISQSKAFRRTKRGSLPELLALRSGVEQLTLNGAELIGVIALR